MKSLSDPDFWLAIGTVLSVIVFATLVILAIRYLLKKIGRWLSDLLSRRLSVQTFSLTRSIAGLIWISILIGGASSLGFTFLIWRVKIGDGLYDPVMRNPLFWLTWLAVTIGITGVGLICGTLLRRSLARVRDRNP
jgi:hypothetical protein